VEEETEPVTEQTTGSESTDRPGDELGDRLRHWLGEHREELVAARRHLHAHPELSGEEHATTEFIAERLEVAGLRPRRLASGTGLVCDLGTGGPLVGLRADIDALAMEDEKDVHYRSRVPGVSHACGHDVHTAVVLGAALFLSHLEPELMPGRVRCIFQPAEERVPGGAVGVIAEGALEGVTALYGVHCDPKLDVGLVGLRGAAITSAADMLTIWLAGPGGHTARPEQTVDMVQLAAEVVRALPGRVQALLGERGPVKLVFGRLHSGDASNVIPTHAELRGSVRTPAMAAWDVLPDVTREALSGIVGGDARVDWTLDYVQGVPPVVNDPEATDLVRAMAVRELGEDAVTETVQSWGGDDFAWYLREVPGSFIRLGIHDPASGGPHLDLHAGLFDVDERAIEVGVRLLVRSAIETLRRTSDATPG
jgi:amidohydrolase